MRNRRFVKREFCQEGTAYLPYGVKSVSQREIGVEKSFRVRFHELVTSATGVVMTTMQKLSYEDEPEEHDEFELPVQLDDDYFEPTIVRGRE